MDLPSAYLALHSWLALEAPINLLFMSLGRRYLAVAVARAQHRVLVLRRFDGPHHHLKYSREPLNSAGKAKCSGLSKPGFVGNACATIFQRGGRNMGWKIVTFMCFSHFGTKLWQAEGGTNILRQKFGQPRWQHRQGRLPHPSPKNYWSKSRPLRRILATVPNSLHTAISIGL